MRAITSFMVKSALIMALLLLLSFSAGGSLAQDVTPEATVTESPTLPPTDAPTEAPTATEIPTDIPTVVPTEVPTEVVTEAPTEVPTEAETAAPTDAPTDVSTEAPTVEATQPPPSLPTVFSEDWQDGDSTGWLITDGWDLTDEAGNITLSTSGASETAVLTAVNWPYFSLTFQTRVAEGGSAVVSMAASGQEYAVVIGSDGSASLLRDDVLLGQASGAEMTSDTPAEPVWHTVQILAPGYLLAVKVDDFAPVSFSDNALSGMGSLIFSTGAANSVAVAFDDISLNQLDAPPPPPVETVVPIPTVMESPEATPEVLAEATDEPVLEATEEATPEATPDMPTFDDAARAKLPAALLDALDARLNEGLVAADAVAKENYLTFDEQGRTPVTLWAMTEADSAAIVSQIQAAGDVVNEVFSVRINALVTLDTVKALAMMPELGSVEVPTSAVSTSNQGASSPSGYGTGNFISEGVDVIGASTWQGATTPVKGAGVGIAIIDTGFGVSFPISTAPPSEYACLGNGSLQSGSAVAGDTTHGLSVLQVVCDVAPQAQAFMYKATNATTLATAINTASSAGRRVILITMDLGASVSPGDGTGGGALYGIDSVYTAITNARNSGAVVVVSAGNSNGSYVALNWIGGTTISANVPVTVFQGDTLHFSWNDWNNNLNGGNLEDFTIVLNSGGGLASPVTIENSSLPSRAAPRASYTIPNGTCAAGCSTSIGFNNYEGDNGNVIIQVQILGQGTINSGGVNGVSVASNAGSIARPADSPDAFAVGAVCINGFNSFPIEASSSIGPAYAAGGALQSFSAPYTRDQIKPDIVGPSHVNINNDGTFDLNDCTDGKGFSGTSAAAAHTAGLAALLISNTNASMNLFDSANSTGVQGIENYLQTHAMDLPFFETPGDFAPTLPTNIQSDSFDMVYGAGFAALGSPTFDLATTTNPATPVDALGGVCTGGIIYSGLASPNTLQQGTLSNPYVSPAFALKQAAANQCVVLLPGEYTGPYYMPNAMSAVGLYSYDAGTSFAASPSVVFMTNNFNSNGGLFIRKNNMVVNGLTVQAGKILNLFSTIGRPKPFTVLSATNFSLLNNTFSGFPLPGDVNSTPSGLIKGNTFASFTIPSTTTGVGVVPESFTAALDIRNAGSTTPIGIENNTFTGITVATNTVQTATWQAAIVGIKNTTANIFANQFTGNTSGSIIGINQWVSGPVANPQPGDKNTGEIRIFSNLFGGTSASFNNTVNGPLIHAFQAPKLRFVNNSVIKNSLGATDNNYDAVILYGIPNVSTSLHLGDRRLEVHNNLFYSNGPVFGGLVANPGVALGCQNISNGASVARNNWFNPVISGGECVGGGNITGSIAELIVAGAATNASEVAEADVFFGSIDPAHPWRLRPGNCSSPCVPASYQGGINTGDMTALSDMFGAPGNPPYPSLLDLRNSGRVAPGGHANATYNNQIVVDVGAYELEPPLPPTATNQSATIAEDSTSSISFTLAATGGYIQSFALGATLPTNYDSDPNNACNGQAVRFTPPKTVTYCPPANFNTQLPTNNPIVISFTVTDTLFYPGQPSDGTITLNITQVDDGTPTVPDFNLITDYIMPMTYQLQPQYTLDNFSVTGTGTNVDYPFTFAFGAQTGGDIAQQNANLLLACPTCDSTATVLTDAFNTANGNGGQLIINPVPGQQGFYRFTYTVTDGDGDVGSGTATLVVLPTLAQDGTYDDASFNIIYNGTGWAPSHVSTAYNTTLHSSTVVNDSIEVPFSGGQVRFNLRGSTNSASTLKLQFKMNIGSGVVSYVDYATAQGIAPTLTCVDSLNNQAPDGSSNVTNFSSTGAAYSISCKGFPLGQAHSVKVTNNLNGAAFTVDSVQVAKGYLSAGSYEETNPNLNYTGTWLDYVATGPKGGSMKYTNSGGANVKFDIDSSVARIVVYRTFANNYGPMEIYIDNVLQTTAPAGTGLTWGQAILVNVASPGSHTVEVRNKTNGLYTGFEALDLLGPVQPLGVGSYEETNGGLTYNGTWSTYTGAGPKGGSMKYTNSGGANVKFDINNTVSRIVIYRTYATNYGQMEIYIDNVLQTTAPAGTGLSWGQGILVTVASPGNHTVEVRNKTNGLYTGFEAFDLLGAAHPLGTGNYEETDPNLLYSGAWSDLVTTGPKGGSMKYTNGGGDNVKFDIDNTVSRIVIYRTFATNYGQMEVYIDNALQGTAPAGSGLTWGQMFLVTVASPGSHTVEIRNKTAGQYTGFEAFDLLGPALRLGQGNYEETDPNLTYTGTWSDLITSGPKGGSMKYTNVGGANVKFDIDNTVSRIIIYRTFATNYGQMEVYIDNVLQATAPAGTGLTWGQAFLVNVASPGDHLVEVRNKTNGQYTGFEAFDLLGPLVPLGAGSYEETNPNLTYTGAWSDFVGSGPKGGSMKLTNAGGANVKFDIDSSVHRIIIYRTFATNYGQMEVYIDNALQATAPAGTGLVWGQAFLVNVTSPGAHMVEIRNKTAGQYTGFEALDLLGPIQPLGVGSYEETDPNLTYTGAWASLVGSGPKGGSMKYTNGGSDNVKFDIDSSVYRIIIYRTFANNYGEMEVYIDNALEATAPAGTGLTWGQPFLVTVTSPGVHTVEVRNKTNGLYTGFEAFDLLGPLQRLGAGNYEETNPNLLYTGAWASFVGTGPKGGSMKYTNGGGDNVKFDIDNTVARVVIYRTFANNYGQMEVYIDNALEATAPAGTGLVWGQPFIVNIASPGDHTIEVRNKTAGQYTGFEAFDLLGQPQRLGIGNYEETNANLTYTGTWSDFVGTGPKGGSMKYTNLAGDNVKFDIDNTVSRIVIYRTFANNYGQMEVYIDNVLEGTAPAGTGLTWSLPFLVTVTSPGDHTVEVRNKTAGQYTGFEAFDLLGPVVPLNPGLYQQNHPDLMYSGVWTTYSGPEPMGGSLLYSFAPGASLTFQFNGDAVAIYSVTVSSGGKLSVTIDSVPKPDINSASPTLRWQQPFIYKGLSSGLHSVVITNISTTTSQPVYVDAIQVYDGVAPLPVGYTQDIDPNLTYRNSADSGPGAWTTDTVLGTTSTNTNGEQMKFQFTGTGFGIFTYNPVNGAPMEVCYKLTPQSDTSYICATTPTNASPAQTTVGYSIYGLKSDDYTVRVRHVGSTGTQVLHIDGVAVLGTPGTTLGAGTYENTNAGIVYTPAALWATMASASYSGGNIAGVTQKGATAQIRFTGTTLVVYRVISTAGSNNSTICVVLQGTSVNPPNQCASFSEFGTTAFQSPVAFYGFGSGTHDVVIENRHHGGLLSIDKITVN
ncbi:MAG: hypothetical protein R3E39_23035 [Anaerolineae bacterium]